MDDQMEITRLQDRVDELEDALRTAERQRDEAIQKADDKDSALNEIYDIARRYT